MAEAAAIEKDAHGRLPRNGRGLSLEKDQLREHLAQANRHIAELKRHIARERQEIEKAIQKGRDTHISESMLSAMEESLRAVEQHRRLILDQLGAD
jgi:hypothetical protein